MPSVIEVKNASMHFSSRKTETVALKDINLNIDSGEFVTLLGASGCGKSTLLNLIAGFLECTSGQVLLEGNEVSGPGADRGVLFQSPALFPWLTVLDNVLFGPRAQGTRDKGTTDKARELLDMVGLTGFEDHYTPQLSGGMRHRVALVRMLINDPAILLMDEPFAALDAQTRTQMQALLLKLCQERGTTVLFVTHDIEEAVLLADRVCVMSPRPGRITDVVDVDFPRPRAYDLTETPDFVALRRRLRLMIAREAEMEMAP